MTTQTRPSSTQNTNTSYNNLMDTQHEEDCQCEDNKPLLPFQSDFARQLHESEVMRRRNPLTTQNRIQREIASNQRQLQQSQPTQHPIEYTQQQTISHTPQQQQHVPQQNALQYTKPPAIEHNQQTSQQALQYTRPSPVIEHNQQISQHVLQQKAISYAPQQQ